MSMRGPTLEFGDCAFDCAFGARITGALIGLVVALLLTALTTAARADPSEAQAADEVGEASELGKKLAREGQLDRALTYFERAYALRQNYITAGNLGTAELKLKRYRDAARHLSEALWELPAERQEVRAGLEDKLSVAKRQVLTLAVEVEPAGATVLLDGEPAGVAPLRGPLFADPGSHTLQATLLDRRGELHTVTGKAGEQQGVRLVAGAGGVSAGGAGDIYGPVPLDDPAPAEEAGGKSGGPGPVKTALVVGGGVATGGLLIFAAIGTGIAAGYSSDVDDIHAALGPNDSSACVEPQGEAVQLCNDLRSALSAGRTWQTLEIGAWIAGAALGVATGAVWLFMPDEPPEPQAAAAARPQVWIAPSGAVFGVEGAF